MPSQVAHSSLDVCSILGFNAGWFLKEDQLGNH